MKDEEIQKSIAATQKKKRELLEAAERESARIKNLKKVIKQEGIRFMPLATFERYGYKVDCGYTLVNINGKDSLLNFALAICSPKDKYNWTTGKYLIAERFDIGAYHDQVLIANKNLELVIKGLEDLKSQEQEIRKYIEATIETLIIFDCMTDVDSHNYLPKRLSKLICEDFISNIRGD